MCGGGGGILGDIAEVALPVLGSILLPGAGAALGIPGLVDAGTGAATALGAGLGGAIGGGAGSALNGGGLTQDLESAGLAGLGSGLINAGGGLTGIGNSIGGAFGDATLGTDVGNSLGNGLSQFTGGLQSLLGGTPGDTTQFQNVLQGVQNDAAQSPTIASEATIPASGQTTLGGGGGATSVGAPGAASLPGASLIGEPSFAPSSSGIGGDSSLLSGGGPTDNLVNQFATEQGNQGVLGLPGASLTGEPTFALQGAPTDSLSPQALSQFNAASPGGIDSSLTQPSLIQKLLGSNVAQTGGNMGIFGNGASSGAGATSGAGTNVLNGLLRGGLGYLLNSPNTQGANAINSAVGAGQAAYAPYLAAGNQAEVTLANLYGNNGTAAQTAAQQNFSNTPGYQFALNQGLNAVNANAAAMGNPLSGNNEQAINNYAQGAAGQNYNNYVNQLQNMASGGANAATGSANLGLTGAGGIAGIGQNNANAKNAAIGQGLQGLFPTGLSLQQLLGSGTNNNSGGLLSLLGL